MVLDDGQVTEVKAPRTRGNKETSKCRIDPKQCRGVGQTSPEIGSKSFAINRNDRSWRDFIKSGRQADVGKIIDRLIFKTEQEIKESEKRTTDLMQQLAELQQIADEFFQEDLD